MHDRILFDGEIRKRTVQFLYCLLSWLPRQEGRRQAPLVTFVTANSCLLREDDYSFPLLLLSRLNKQKKHRYTTGFSQTEKHEKRQYNFCTVFFRDYYIRNSYASKFQYIRIILIKLIRYISSIAPKGLISPQF